MTPSLRYRLLLQICLIWTVAPQLAFNKTFYPLKVGNHRDYYMKSLRFVCLLASLAIPGLRSEAQTIQKQLPSEPDQVIVGFDYVMKLFSPKDQSLPESILAKRAGALVTTDGSTELFESAITMLETTWPLDSSDIRKASEMFQRALVDAPPELKDDILLALGLLYRGHGIFLFNHSVEDSIIMFLQPFVGDSLDHRLNSPVLKNSSALWLVNYRLWGMDRTDQIGLATLFWFYIWDAVSFASNLRYPYDSLRVVGEALISKFPLHPYNVIIKALLYLHRIRSMTPEQTLLESRPVLASCDPANAVEVYRQLGEYMFNRGRYDLLDTLRAELAARFSPDDYYAEVTGLGFYYPGLVPLEFPRNVLRWREKTIKVFLTAKEGHSPVTAAELANLQKALRTWRTILAPFGVDFQLVNQPSERTIKVFMCDTFSGAGLALVGGWVNGDILSADIFINRTLSPSDEQKTLVHELGHALGLRGHSFNKEDVMHFTTSSITRAGADSVVSNRDSVTMTKIYKTPRIENGLYPFVKVEVNNGGLHTFEVQVSDLDGLEDVDSVFVDLRLVGGAMKQLMASEGLGWYRVTVPIMADTVPYTIKPMISFVVKDNSGLSVWNRIANFWVKPIMTLVEREPIIPTEYTLSQNYPNPFNPSTTIEFALPERTFVTLKVMNLLGQQIETLVQGEKEAGHHKVLWHSRRLPSGVYFYRLETAEFSQTNKMLLVK